MEDDLELPPVCLERSIDLSEYRLAVDESGAPLMQDQNLLLVGSSGEFFAVEDSHETRDYYNLNPISSVQQSSGLAHSLTQSSIAPQLSVPPQPSTSQSSISQNPINPQSSFILTPHNQLPSKRPRLNLIKPTSPGPTFCTPSTSSSEPITEKNRKGQSRWTHGASLLLIDMWRQRRDRFENNIERNEPIWDEISQEMRNNGFNFTSHQVENKFKYLKKSYIDCIDKNRKSTGEPERFCSYYEELDELFRQSPQVHPPALAASRSIHLQNENNVISSGTVGDLRPVLEQLSQGTAAQQTSGPTTSSLASEHLRAPRRTRMERTVGRWAEEFRTEARQREEARARRHEELMELLRQSNALYERLTQQLIDKL